MYILFVEISLVNKNKLSDYLSQEVFAEYRQNKCRIYHRFIKNYVNVM